MKKIMVGLSGGVDSAVAAYLLKNQGNEVAGATFRMTDEWDGGEDARAVAESIGIPFHVFDFRKIFREMVLDNFAEEYKEGRTPNPCVRCNKYIKFPAFLEEAQKLGYDCISTGHYVRTDGESIYRAKDLAKDQSYMLYNLTKELISHLVFPLSDLTKDEIRSIAAEAGIPVADKPDSQDICFIPDGDTQGYLEKAIGSMPEGDFVNGSGAVLGRHKGIFRYTIGQHKGLGLSTPDPLYVGKIDADSNRITLVDNDELFTSRLVADDFNWIEGLPKQPLFVTCKVRYAAKPAPALACTFIREDMAIINFDEPQRAVTPGQSVVIYQGDKLLGGGIIKG